MTRAELVIVAFSVGRLAAAVVLSVDSILWALR